VKTVEIFSIGDELLRGIVADTNSNWIAKRVAARGAALQRVTTLPDDPQIVGAEIRAAIERGPDLLVTQGGLGPTDDDRTREAVAIGTDRPQRPDEGAEAIVRARFEQLARDGAVAHASLDDARMRMAHLPEGARALENDVGTAPGIVLPLDRTTIVCLPGVPPELHWIWEHPLAAVLDDVLGPGGFDERTFETDVRDESRMAYLLRLVAERHPGVYVKSRAHGFDEGDEVRITLAAAGEDDAAARALVDEAERDLRAALAAEGVSLR
jgi:molybdenum cofactor synthesis domain-containing protein